jgi:hypothetical protein
MTKDTTTPPKHWEGLTEAQRMRTIWRSYLRLVVEAVEPDRWSLGPYIEATFHYRDHPERFAPETIEKVKAYVRANWPDSWAQYEALIPAGYRVELRPGPSGSPGAKKDKRQCLSI